MRAALATERLPDALEFIEPQAATWEDLALVHTHEYLDESARAARFRAEEIASSSSHGRRRSSTASV